MTAPFASSFFPGVPSVMNGLRLRSTSVESIAARSYFAPRARTSLRTRAPSMFTPSGIEVPGLAKRAFETAFLA